jgi:hypothetical protein
MRCKEGLYDKILSSRTLAGYPNTRDAAARLTMIVEELAPSALVDENNQIDHNDEADAGDNSDVKSVKL